MDQKIIIAILLVVILALSGLLYIASEAEDDPSDGLVGDDRDEHGCLGTAGYAWDQGIAACVREWELDESQKEAAKIAADYLGFEGLTVTRVDVLRCPGCFDVTLTDVSQKQYVVEIRAWNASKKTGEIVDFEDCIAAGYPAMESYPRQCRTADGQHFVEEIPNDIGKACEQDSDCSLPMEYAIISSCPYEMRCAENKTCEVYCPWDEGPEKVYCTPEQRDAEACTLEYRPVCGWFKQNVQCLLYPCAADYGNPCQACADGKVSYWTKGACPEP